MFTLLELIPKANVRSEPGERVYIGKNMTQRKRIARVRGRVGYEALTAAAQRELPAVLLDLVERNEPRFVQFFNESAPITTRFHALELLPGLGKKTMWSILAERRKGAFGSFADLAERVGINPSKLIARRAELEISDPTQKYHLFAQP